MVQVPGAQVPGAQVPGAQVPRPQVPGIRCMMASGWLALFVSAASSVVALAGSAAAQDVPSFYTAGPQEIAGRPGTVIRQEALTGSVPEGAKAWRLLYRSTGLDGEPVAASAVLVVPDGAPPADGVPVVSWQHPTSGVDRLCAPSLSRDVLKMIMGLPELLKRGYAVVAPDYPGLGTPGPHPYLVGESEGHAVLDAVRAARNAPEAHAGQRFAVWGHSQGGHATLFAGLLAQSYAPELQLVGVAAAAPASELDKLFGAVAETPDEQLFSALLMSAWSGVYDISLDRLVAASDQPAVETLAHVCFDPPMDSDTQPPDAAMPDAGYKMLNPIGKTQPWSSLAAHNTAGVLPAGVPAFLAQGSADTTIAPEVTADYMARLCKAGVSVRMVEKPGVVHRLIAREAADEAVRWIGDRFAGLPAPSDCP